MSTWIKMRTNLRNDPRVRLIAKKLSCNVSGVTGERLACHVSSVIGGLYVLWALADEYSLDGKLVGYDGADLDKEFGRVGFAAALASPEIGWLEIGDNYLIVPRFEEHNGESAKARAQTAKRVGLHRRNAAAVTKSLQKALPEKRREEKNRQEKKENTAASAAGLARAEIEIPAQLKTAEFSEAWGRWLKHRGEKKSKLTPTAVEGALKKLSELGPTRAVEALNHSIANGWAGIFEPKPDASANGTNGRKEYRGQRLERESAEAGGWGVQPRIVDLNAEPAA